MKKHKNKIIAASAIVLLLVVTFFMGANVPTDAVQEKENISQASPMPEASAAADVGGNGKLSAEEKMALAKQIAGNTKTEEKAQTAVPSAEENTNASEMPLQEEIPTQAAVVESPLPENTAEASDTLTCTLSVRCDAALANSSLLESGKTEILPEDGVIFPEQSVVFYEGENIFNVLLREMKKNKIHLEFMRTPVYNSVYIEGIGNLYEFDCGEISGWMYKVNDWFPNFGCSRYQLKDGDKVEFVYTCNLGVDIGGYNDLSGE